MGRLPGLQDIRKKWMVRARIWIIWLIAMLLTDEYIKEGYFFKISDVIIPGTHENIITTLIIIWLIIELIAKKRAKK